MQLTRAQGLVAAAAVVAACAGTFALGHASAPDEPPRLPDAPVAKVTVEPVGEGLLVPPTARIP